VTLAPGAIRQVQVRLIYPADATPPQVLSLLPAPLPASGALPASGGPEAVKQSPVRPLSSDR
jgi:hypothetical protein